MDHICVMRRNLFIIFKNVSPTDGASTATSTVSCAHTFVWPIVSSSVSIFTIYQTRTFASRNLKFVTYLKFNLTIWSLHHLQTWEFWLRIEILVKNRNFYRKLKLSRKIAEYFGRKSILRSKVEIFVKKSNICSKIKILAEDQYLGQKLKFWSRIEILIKNLNLGRKLKVDIFWFKKSKFWAIMEILVKKRNLPQKFKFSRKNPKI